MYQQLTAPKMLQTDYAAPFPFVSAGGQLPLLYNGLMSDLLLPPGATANPVNLYDSYALLNNQYLLNSAALLGPAGFGQIHNPIGGVKRPMPDYTQAHFLGSTYSLESEQNDSKKSKLDGAIMTNREPSSVLHIRNIAARAAETDLTLLAVPFGKIKCMVYAKKTNQALMEMEDGSEAARMFDYYSEFAPSVNGRKMVIQYSRHAGLELKLQNSSVEAAVHAANRMVTEHRATHPDVGERRILRVVLDNCRDCAITHLVIYKVFQRFGSVLRVIIFNKNLQCQCLVEMDNLISAHVALLHLNGQDLFPECCRLRVEFSRNSESLQVARQTDRCRDYLLSPLAPEERLVLELMDCCQQPVSSASSCLSAGDGGFGQNQLHLMSQNQPFSNNDSLNLPIASSVATVTEGGLAIPGSQKSLTYMPTNDLIFSLFPFAGGSGGGTQFPSLSLAAPQYPMGRTLPPSTTACSHDHPTMMPSSLPPPPPPPIAQSSQQKNSTLTSQLDSTSILVSQVDDQKTGPDQLYNLFGVYGNVRKVTMLQRNSGMALITMETSQEAELACRQLRGVPLFGRCLDTLILQQQQQSGPGQQAISLATQTGAYISREYGSRDHQDHCDGDDSRFSPSSTLSLSNLPSWCSHIDIGRLFGSAGLHIRGVSLTNDNADRKVSMVQFNSVEDAVLALVRLQNSILADGAAPLQLSFCASSSESRAPSRQSTTSPAH